MAMPKKSEKAVLRPLLRACVTKDEYAALGRLARTRGMTVSAFTRDLLQAVLAANSKNAA